jgi:hypothetical protein
VRSAVSRGDPLPQLFDSQPAALHAGFSGSTRGFTVSSRGKARLPRRIALIAMLSLPFARVSLASTHPAIAPNQDFSNPILRLHAPASTGWYGISQTRSRIAFGKAGAAPDETFVASVFLFRIPTFADEEAFTEYVREDVIKDSPTDRFETVEQSIQYSPDRAYACVRYHGISVDKRARTSAIFRKSLRLEILALYCQHPDKPGLGFSASYSHRGGDPGYIIADEAAAFIESVQVASSSKTP